MISPDQRKIYDEIKIGFTLVLLFLGVITGALFSMSFKLFDIIELIRKSK